MKGPNLLLPLRLVPELKNSLTPFLARLRSQKGTTFHQAQQAANRSKVALQDTSIKSGVCLQMTQAGYRSVNHTADPGCPLVTRIPPARHGLTTMVTDGDNHPE